MLKLELKTKKRDRPLAMLDQNSIRLSSVYRILHMDPLNVEERLMFRVELIPVAPVTLHACIRLLACISVLTLETTTTNSQSTHGFSLFFFWGKIRGDASPKFVEVALGDFPTSFPDLLTSTSVHKYRDHSLICTNKCLAQVLFQIAWLRPLIQGI